MAKIRSLVSSSDLIEATLSMEGGYSKDRSDPGGATAFGISSRFNPEWADSIRAGTFTREDAVSVYQRKYITPAVSFFLGKGMPVCAFLIFEAVVTGQSELIRFVEDALSYRRRASIELHAFDNYVSDIRNNWHSARLIADRIERSALSRYGYSNSYFSGVKQRWLRRYVFLKRFLNGTVL